MADVADLLRQSRAANDAFHVAQQKKRPAQAAGCIQEARAKRLAAHEADPLHLDPVWLDDKADHTEIVAFYDRYI